MDLFDNIKIGKGRPKKGRILISEPFMYDPNFKRSVVLLTEHNEEGTVGFILNKHTELKLNEVLEDFPEFDAPVYMGGPVRTDTLHFVHRVGELEGATEVIEDVYWDGNFEALRVMVDTKQVGAEEFRFFVGYSGWMPGQLDGELKEKSWILADVDSDDIFVKEPDDLWKEVLKDLGKEYEMMSNFPEDPSLN